MKGSRYCMSMADIGRLILAAEEKFFNECNAGNGRLLCCHGNDNDSDMIIVECLLLLC